MVNNSLSTKAGLLMELRKKPGVPLSGTLMARTLGVSRVAVWKGIRSLIEAGYSIAGGEKGYTLDPKKPGDFLYPWEFGEREPLFRHFAGTGSTMDRAREAALQGAADGTVITAEKQSAGRGRNGRNWASRQGGLFFTLLERPALALADYTLSGMVLQIAVARALSALCGKQTALRWPNDVYIDQRKIAGVLSEVSGEGDVISWIAGGVGVNVNNPALSGKSTSCSEILRHPVSRREVLAVILNEADSAKRRLSSGAVYSQGNRALAAEWNSLAAGIGAQAAVIDSGFGETKPEAGLKQNRVLARGIFAGVDPAGRCVIKNESGKGALYFNPGPVSLLLF